MARNDGIFREANELIRERAEHLRESGYEVPFLCECADLECTTVVRLTLDAYEHVRSFGDHFINAHGHERSAGRHVRVVERHDGYCVVEKVGRAGELVEESDPRSAEVSP